MNDRHFDYRSNALPTELLGRNWSWDVTTRAYTPLRFACLFESTGFYTPSSYSPYCSDACRNRQSVPSKLNHTIGLVGASTQGHYTSSVLADARQPRGVLPVSTQQTKRLWTMKPRALSWACARLYLERLALNQVQCELVESHNNTRFGSADCRGHNEVQVLFTGQQYQRGGCWSRRCVEHVA